MRTSPNRTPVVRRIAFAVSINLRLPPHIKIPIWIILPLLRLLEPFMLCPTPLAPTAHLHISSTHLIRGMINYQVHQEFHPALMAPLDQLVHIFHRPIRRMDILIIRDIITHIYLWRFVDRTYPDDIDA
jgi:hypothetical protein